MTISAEEIAEWKRTRIPMSEYDSAFVERLLSSLTDMKTEIERLESDLGDYRNAADAATARTGALEAQRRKDFVELTNSRSLLRHQKAHIAKLAAKVDSLEASRLNARAAYNARIAQLTAERDESVARSAAGYDVIRKCALAIGNGALIGEQCSDEFHHLVPAEIEIYCKGIRARIAALEAQLAEAVAALEPFAKEESTWANSVADDYRPGIVEPNQRTAHAKAEFSIGDLRRAAAIRARSEQEVE